MGKGLSSPAPPGPPPPCAAVPPRAAPCAQSPPRHPEEGAWPRPCKRVQGSSGSESGNKVLASLVTYLDPDHCFLAQVLSECADLGKVLALAALEQGLVGGHVVAASEGGLALDEWLPPTVAHACSLCAANRGCGLSDLVAGPALVRVARSFGGGGHLQLTAFHPGNAKEAFPTSQRSNGEFLIRWNPREARAFASGMPQHGTFYSTALIKDMLYAHFLPYDKLNCCLALFSCQS